MGTIVGVFPTAGFGSVSVCRSAGLQAGILKALRGRPGAGLRISNIRPSFTGKQRRAQKAGIVYCAWIRSMWYLIKARDRYTK